MPKFYFNSYDENCYTLAYFKEYMKENGIKETQVFEAVADKGSPYFYCNEFSEIGEVGQGCGKICESYKPRNGKNGRCVHSGHVYDQGKSKIIKIK